MSDTTLSELLWRYDPSGIVVADQDMIIRQVNPAFCRIFRVDADTITGQPLSRALREEPRYFISAWNDNRPLRGHDKLYMDNNAYVRHLIVPLKENGLVVGILTDMTEEWRRRQMLETARKQIMEEQQALGHPDGSRLPAILKTVEALLA